MKKIQSMYLGSQIGFAIGTIMLYYFTDFTIKVLIGNFIILNLGYCTLWVQLYLSNRVKH